MKVAGLLSGLLACLLTGCISAAVPPASDQCGIRPYDWTLERDQRDPRKPRDPRDPRIVGGHFAAYGEYPWQARVDKVGEKWHCGAAIINQYWLLSATHCFDPTRPNNYRIVVGDRDIRKHDLDEQTFDIDTIINHPDYKPHPSHQNDIALIKIRPSNGTGIQYSDNIQPACLPSALTPHTVGTDCLISGWGSLVFRGHYPDILKGAVVKIMKEDHCKQAHEPYYDGMMCAGLKDGGVDTCSGDSGGPLVVKVNGSYTLLGLTSHGDGCATAGEPGFYARVAHFLPWIKDHIDANSNCGENIMPKP